MYGVVAYEPVVLEIVIVHAVENALVVDVVAAIVVWVSDVDVANVVDCVASVKVAAAGAVVPIVADATFADGDAFAVDAAGHFASAADVVKGNAVDVVAHGDVGFVAYDFSYAVVAAAVQLAVATVVVVVVGDVAVDTG